MRRQEYYLHFIVSGAIPPALTRTLVPHIYASVNWVGIGSGNGLSPVRRQAITWTDVG